MVKLHQVKFMKKKGNLLENILELKNRARLRYKADEQIKKILLKV